jgi:hypothetical protein
MADRAQLPQKGSAVVNLKHVAIGSVVLIVGLIATIFFLKVAFRLLIGVAFIGLAGWAVYALTRKAD